MQDNPPPCNTFSYSLHSSGSYEGGHYGTGFKAITSDDWRAFAHDILKFAWGSCVWRKGMRDEESFLYSDLCAMDFDNPEDFPLDQAIKTFCDTQHVIGTTRRHQVVGKDGLVGDRFRVIIPWERRITRLKDYRYNMQWLKKNRHDIDRNALDGARLWFKCSKIIAGSASGHRMEVKEAPEDFEKKVPPEIYAAGVAYKKALYEATNSLPPTIRLFLERGEPFGQAKSREVSCSIAALHLFECGLSEEAITARLMMAPFDREGFDECKEIAGAIRSAKKTFEKGLTDGKR